ncbi:MAG TPA: methylated-DNA--[protein]-cysteine S-methyltransferase [Trueperaceae bacterium]|nr:methylated-DNA--[protein]-cysteine S-methyltransferase [Trueperaceae bacterium]
MSEFKDLVIKIIKTIPKGKVMTYGQIATLAGSPRAARQVAAILRANSEAEELAWHRVVNAEGKLSTHKLGFGDLQEALLKREEIVFKSGKLDLGKYRWRLESE